MLSMKKDDKLRKGIGKSFSFLTANQWSYIALIFTVISAYFIINQWFLLAGLLFAAGGVLDFVDGAVARFRREATKKGAYLDTILDRYTEAIIIFALIFVSIPTLFLDSKIWLFLYLFGSMMTTYAKAAAAEKKIIYELNAGILQRQDRILILIAALFAAAFNLAILGYFIVILAILTNISALQRIFMTMKRRKK